MVKLPEPVTPQARTKLDQMNPRVYSDFESHMRSITKWLHKRGKDPRRRQGYAKTTIKTTIKKIDRAYRWKWNDYGGYTREFTHDDADRFMDYLDWEEDYTDSSLTIYVKSLKRLFKFQEHSQNKSDATDWDCKIELSQKNHSTRDHFRKEEFQQLYEGALNLGTIKSYTGCTPEERSQLKGVLAQRFDKSKSEVTPDDWKRANGWKIPSLVSVTLDVGLRPIEVGRATTDWFRPILHGKQELDIPYADATKNDENWSPAVSNRTVTAVRNWLDERRTYDKYADTKKMWITRYSNEYESSSLNRLLNRILEQSEVDDRGRQLSWYSIRHGVATIWANEVGVEDAREQLRHKSAETTLRYVRSTPERRAKEINKMW